MLTQEEHAAVRKYTLGVDAHEVHGARRTDEWFVVVFVATRDSQPPGVHSDQNGGRGSCLLRSSPLRSVAGPARSKLTPHLPPLLGPLRVSGGEGPVEQEGLQHLGTPLISPPLVEADGETPSDCLGATLLLGSLSADTPVDHTVSTAVLPLPPLLVATTHHS